MSDNQEKPNPMTLRTVTAADLAAADPQPPSFVIDQYYPEGLILKGGSPKIGKSFMALQEALAVANGKPFWNRRTVKGDVLLLSLEDSAARINKRLKGMTDNPPSNLYIVSANDSENVKKINHGLIEQLKEQLQIHPDLRLVIIDTIQRVKEFGKRQATSYENDTEIFAPLQRFAIQNHLAIVGITHLTKEHYNTDPFERMQGSMGGVAVADCLIAITGNRGEDSTLDITGRDIEGPGKYKIRFNNGVWECLGSEEAIKESDTLRAYQHSMLVKTVQCLLNENGGLWDGSAKTLLEEIQNRNRGKCSIPNAREVGRQIKAYREIFLSVDGISYDQDSGGRNGRDYHFRQFS